MLMSAGRMNQLVVMVSLCSSIVEGIEHVLAHEGNERLKDDAVAGLETLEANLGLLGADHTVIYETRWVRELLKNWVYAFDREFKNKLYRWYCLVLKELRNLMVAETEKCPVCGGKGVPHYGAVYYTLTRKAGLPGEQEPGSSLAYAEGSPAETDFENGSQKDKEENLEDAVMEPVRVLMKCKECGNYYAAKDEGLGTSSREKARRSKLRCEKLIADIKEFAPEGAMLFIGDEKCQLYKEARKAGYEPAAVFTGTQEEGWEKRKYRIVVIDRIPGDQDTKELLLGLSDYLEEDGILWFDGPDLDKCFRNLEKKGTPVWNEAIDEICLTESGLDRFAEECGLTVKFFRHVGRVSGRIEVIAGRKSSRKEGMIYGASDNP